MSVVTRVRTLDPLTLGPALWLDDTGSDASVWTDKSGNGLSATQGTASAQPQIIPSALNGRQVRRFNGSTRYMSLPNSLSSNLAGFTICLAGKATNNATRQGFVAGIFSANTLFHLAVEANRSGAQWNCGGRRVSEDSYRQLDTGTVGNFGIISTVWNFTGTRMDLSVNGTTVSDASFQTSGNSSSAASTWALGCSFIGSTPGNFLNGDIAEIIVYPYALTSYERQLVEGYLSYKYALPVA